MVAAFSLFEYGNGFAKFSKFASKIFDACLSLHDAWCNVVPVLLPLVLVKHVTHNSKLFHPLTDFVLRNDGVLTQVAILVLFQSFNARLDTILFKCKHRGFIPSLLRFWWIYLIKVSFKFGQILLRSCLFI